MTKPKIKYRLTPSHRNEELKNNIKFSKTVLPNGIRIISEEIKTSTSFAFGVFIDAGSNCDFKNLDGLAHFVEHASFRKTRKNSGRKLNTAFESIGAYTNAFTTKEATCYYVRAIQDNFKPCVRLMSEIVLHPIYIEKDIEKEKLIILEEIKSYDDEPEEVIFDYGDKILFGTNPLSHPIVGNLKSVKNISVKDVIEFHDKYYSPSNIVISYAGPLEHQKLLEIIWQNFDKFDIYSSNNFEQTDFSDIINSPTALSYKKRFSQSHLLINRLVCGMNSDERYLIAALNFILGEGLSSRLHKKLREDKSLVYTVYSSLQLFKKTGSISIYAAGEKNNHSKIRTLIEKELENLHKNGITKLELKIAKEQLKSNTIMALESMSARIQNIAKSELSLGHNESLTEIIKKIDSISIDDLNFVAKKYFVPESWNSIIFL